MKLSQEEYDIQKLLAEQHVIAPMELKREESKYINRKLSYQQTASLLISNIASQRSTEKEILELKKNVTEQRDIFLQALNTLQSAVATWKTKYVVIAPVQGRTYFAASLQENQNLTVNQELMYIAPPTSSYFGELRIPQQNFGKVKLGQDVIIKFIGYPYQEFGSVKGRIVSIAEVPMKDSVFLAKVDLISGLKTSYGKKIVYKTGMSASADIITADNRLMEKLLFQLRKLPYGGSI
jgi:HlyD family secretion protein